MWLNRELLNKRLKSCLLTLIIFVAIVIFFSLFNSYNVYAEEENELKELLINRLYMVHSYETLNISSQQLYSGDILFKFYKQRDFELVWTGKEGLLPRGAELFSILVDSNQEALIPHDYHLHTITGIWFRLSSDVNNIDPGIIINMELLLTDAFFLYISDYKNGRIDPETLKRKKLNIDHYKAVQTLENALIKENLVDEIKRLNPSHSIFDDLHQLMNEYIHLVNKGGWQRIPHGPTLKEGDQGNRIELLRKRLKKEPGQFIELKTEEKNYFDKNLALAVKNFQKRHQLKKTGHLDSQTLEALNISAKTLLNHIKINLERWRWLPQDLEDNYIFVNLPEFKLTLIEDNEQIMEMKAVIGQKQRQTPVSSSKISHLVFSPRWYIPKSIAINDYLPHVKEDPDYLTERNIRVYKSTDADFKEVEIDKIDWDKIDAQNFNYYFWQDSGPWNALGNVIFKFPNPYSVYLHDTPDRHLFDEEDRSFSSGCIRIEKAMDLALHLLSDQPEWTPETVDELIEKREETIVFLDEFVPIHLLYMTTWVSEEGMLILLNDIYDRDLKLKDVFF